eukprot:354135-Chlamydomonas_euryale.AAC.5
MLDSCGALAAPPDRTLAIALGAAQAQHGRLAVKGLVRGEQAVIASLYSAYPWHSATRSANLLHG